MKQNKRKDFKVIARIDYETNQKLLDISSQVGVNRSKVIRSLIESAATNPQLIKQLQPGSEGNRS